MLRKASVEESAKLATVEDVQAALQKRCGACKETSTASAAPGGVTRPAVFEASCTVRTGNEQGQAECSVAMRYRWCRGISLSIKDLGPLYRITCRRGALQSHPCTQQS